MDYLDEERLQKMMFRPKWIQASFFESPSSITDPIWSEPFREQSKNPTKIGLLKILNDKNLIKLI